MKHLKIGGSTAARTIACPGWLEMSTKVPKPRSSNAADEGNLLHDAMENFYEREESFEDQVKHKLTYQDQVLVEDHIDTMLNPAMRMVEHAMDTYEIVDYFCEPFVQIIPDEMGGSVDMLALSEDGKTLMILDYKFGRVAVKAEKNKQLMFYALASREDPKTKHLWKKVKKVVLVIVQPASSHQYSFWETTPKEIQRFSDTLFKALEKPDYLEAGRHCHFCPAAAICKTKKAQVRSTMIMNKGTAIEVAEALTMADELESWIKQVRELSHQYMEQGTQVPGFKLVQKRAIRKWANEGEVYGALKMVLPRNVVYTEKLATPPQIEKALKKEKIDFDLATLITAESSGTTIAPESDKREAVDVDVHENLKKVVDKKLNKK